VNKPLVIARIEQTCTACPSQWNAWTDDGEYVYIRYRWGCLSIDRAMTPDAWREDDCEVVLEKDIGELWDGQMSYDELKRFTKDVLVLPAEQT
jgi:hypothetical protein